MDYYCRSWYFYDFRSEHILGTAIKSNSYFTAFISSPTKYTANIYIEITMDSWARKKVYTVPYTVQYRIVGGTVNNCISGLQSTELGCN